MEFRTIRWPFKPPNSAAVPAAAALCDQRPPPRNLTTVGGGVVGDNFSGKLADSGISPQIWEILGFPLRRKVATSLLGAREASWMGAAWWKMLFWKKKVDRIFFSTIFFFARKNQNLIFRVFSKIWEKNPKIRIFCFCSKILKFRLFQKKSRFLFEKVFFFRKSFFNFS